jgi:hypothetical protein
MSKLLVALVVVVGSGASMSASPARADDAYVCDDGRLVYARPETIDKLKATDPCIARYFTATPPPIAAAPVAKAVGAAKPAAPQAGVSPAAAAPAQVGAKIGSARPSKVREVSPAVPEKHQVPEAAVGTDFRNVRVINAEPGSAQVFRHWR